MPDYPITTGVQEAMQRFPAISGAATIPSSGRSKLENVRLLDNTHYDHIQRLLQFLNIHLPSSGGIGKRVVQQTDFFGLTQTLAEFFLLAHFRSCHEAYGKDSSTGSPSEKNYDIDLITGPLNARIEICCPVDFYGCQLAERHLPVLF